MNPIVQKIADDRAAQISSSQSDQDHARFLQELSAIISNGLAMHAFDLQNSTLKTAVTNQPQVQPVAGTIEVMRARTIERGLYELLQATVANRYESPATQEVAGTVSVDNFPPFPDIAIPQPLERVTADIATIPQELTDLLVKLRTAVEAIEVKPFVSVETPPAPQVTVSSDALAIEVSELKILLQELISKQYEPVETDMSTVVAASKSTTDAVKNLKFPVPNFQSSWQHSRYMQTLDSDTAYTNATISTPDAIDGLTSHRAVTAISVTLGDGIWTQTLSYNTYGEVASRTRWLKTG